MTTSKEVGAGMEEATGEEENGIDTSSRLGSDSFRSAKIVLREDASRNALSIAAFRKVAMTHEKIYK